MDNPILAYHEAIENGTVTVGYWIRLFYAYLVNGILEGRFAYDAKKANKAIRFIENFCHHCEGRDDLLVLELWQKALVATIFGITDIGGNRQFREVFLVVGRKNGKSLLAAAIIACALVTDAGMPAISDPGEDLVRMCYENGIEVESVPGPCALVTALAMSGMKSGRFCFEGFLSVNKPSRKAHLEELKRETRTMVFYEAPHKLPATLKDMYATFGDRKIAIVRELTKLHEEVIHTTLGEAISLYDDEKKARGEFVLIIDGYTPEAEEEFTLEQAVEIAKGYIEKGDPTSMAAKKAATDTGFKKGDIYKLLTK